MRKTEQTTTPEHTDQHGTSTSWILVVIGILLVAGVSFFLLQAPSMDEQLNDEVESIEVATPQDDEAIELEPAVTQLDIPPPRTSTGEVPNTGSISGTVRLAKELVGTIDQYRVTIEEAVNTEAALNPGKKLRRFQQTFQLEPGLTTARFPISGLPFSSYGWRVSVAAPGKEVNGSEELAVLSESTPSAEVVLTLAATHSAHLVVKDQDREAIPNIDLILKPIGHPRGRSIYTGKTNAYGLVLLEKMRAGSYKLYVGSQTRPFLPPVTIEMPAHKHLYHAIELPRGAKLVVKIVGAAGQPLADVEIQARFAKPRALWREYQARTNRVGEAVLEHLPSGPYGIHATKKGFERGYKSVKMGDSGEQKTQIMLRYSF